jgi:hypothetical protein
MGALGSTYEALSLYSTYLLHLSELTSCHLHPSNRPLPTSLPQTPARPHAPRPPVAAAAESRTKPRMYACLTTSQNIANALKSHEHTAPNHDTLFEGQRLALLVHFSHPCGPRLGVGGIHILFLRMEGAVRP